MLQMMKSPYFGDVDDDDQVGDFVSCSTVFQFLSRRWKDDCLKFCSMKYRTIGTESIFPAAAGMNRIRKWYNRSAPWTRKSICNQF